MHGVVVASNTNGAKMEAEPLVLAVLVRRMVGSTDRSPDSSVDTSHDGNGNFDCACGGFASVC